MKQDLIKTKICSRCKKEKPISEFGKDKSRKDSLKRYCKNCLKDYYKENKEKYLEQIKQWRINNPIRYWCQSTIKNHKRRGYEVLFTVKELLPIAKQTTYCPVCDVRLQYNGKRNQKNNASLDRINDDKTLTLDNVQIISFGCNRTKGDMSMKEFIKYCKKVVNRYG